MIKPGHSKINTLTRASTNQSYQKGYTVVTGLEVKISVILKLPICFVVDICDLLQGINLDKLIVKCVLIN